MAARKSDTRLYAKYKFKNVSPEQLKVIDDAVTNLLRKFTMIFAVSEASVYKIVNHIIDKHHLTSNEIKTLDGVAIEAYLDASAKRAYNHIRLGEMLKDGVLSDVSGKLLVIPKMEGRWSRELAFYFYNELKYNGCLGIIFYSEGENNFGQVLLEKTTLNVIEFPEPLGYKRRVVEDDDW